LVCGGINFGYIGLLAGALAGYLGGWVDKAIMFVMTVVWSVPGIMLVIAISLALAVKVCGFRLWRWA
jgi:ABC-type dipeptide/oligopeptide/nickel transport system permease subunit